MKVLEIKNNLVKVSYDIEDKLVLAGFAVIEDENTPYVGQIVSLKADNNVSYAIVKLLFTFDSEGIVKNYDGSIPALNANVTRLTAAELLDILPVKTPLKIGCLAQQDFLLNVDSSMLHNNLLICSDSAKNTATLVLNFAKQLENSAQSSIIFDIDGKYQDEKKFVFGKDFKLPLNFETINFIYGNDLNDIDSTSKAIIQDIFLEVQEYTRTIPDKYIPFDTFIDVVTQQYIESNMPELALLKNKLLKYKEEKVFAQSKYEISSLKEYIKDNYTVILDISNADSNLQQEIISYVYKVLDEINSHICSFVKVNDKNSDKKLLKLLLNTNKIYTNIICNHNYKYVYELKEKADDIILFIPETTRHDFASYNTFLNKLNHDEFIIWGKSTQSIPLIVELAPVEIKKDEPIQTFESTPGKLSQPFATADKEEEIEESVQDKVVFQTEVEQDEEKDFTQNEDTYLDLSDDIERKTLEEEDYSAIKNQEPEDIEIIDDFDKELKNNIEESIIDEPVLKITGPEIIDEAPTNDFFTANNPQEELKGIDIKEIPDFYKHETIAEEENYNIESDENIEPATSEIILLNESIDEHIEEDLPVMEIEENQKLTPFENIQTAKAPSLIQEDETANDELIEQVAKDIDKNFIYTKIEQDNLDDSVDEDILTEDDLNFIDDINQGENDLLEPIVDEPQEFEDELNTAYYEEEEVTAQTVPVYPAKTPQNTQTFEQGDHVSHPKYGEGIVEKMIKYGDKTLCSINFINIGRRLLDPAISEITKL